MSLKLIVGLGNPGIEYEKTRHNVGFMVIDELIKVLNTSLTIQKFQGIYTKVTFNEQNCVIAKPLTFMNLSGLFVKQLCGFYKIVPENILVIYDDIVFNLGQIKLRQEGSAGGHNGMANIIKCFGTEKIKRIRFGIGPINHLNLAQFVLSKFNPNQQLLLETGIAKATLAACNFLENDFNNLMNKFNK